MGFEAEICVLGGGPAGSVIACRLSQLGYETLVIERDPWGLGKRVESFPSSIAAILGSLTLSDALEAATLQREKRELLRWASDSIEEKSLEPPSLLVDRTFFDRRLRAAAASAGAVVLAPVHARAPQRTRPGRWVIPAMTEQGPTPIKARFLIDARGRRGGQHYRHGPPTAALSATWHVAGGAYRETRTEAGMDEWFWGCPLTKGVYAATIFVDAHRIAGRGAHERSELYRELVSRSQLLRLLRASRMATSITVSDATSRIAVELIQRDFIRVGDAAFAIDPLSSQGVQRAILSAIQGAAAVHTICTNGDIDSASTFYCERQLAAAKQASVDAMRLYRDRAGGKGPFWTTRSNSAVETPAALHQSPNLPGMLPLFVRVSDAVEIVNIPVLSGPLIKRAAALKHPRLKQPVAFLGDIPLAQLVIEVGNGLATDQLLSCWSARMRPETARHILEWMYSSQILEDVSRHPSSRVPNVI